MRNRNNNSKIFNVVEEELQSINEIKDASVSLREFNKIKFPAPRHYSGTDVVKIRKQLHVSQAVFAHLLNASTSTVRKWEIGEKHPGGPSLKLLNILDRKGIEALV